MKTAGILKKVAAMTLCAVLIASAVVTVPTVISDKGIVASAAETYGDYQNEVAENNEIQLLKYNGNGDYVVIPSQIDGKNVTSIAKYAFNNQYSINSVDLPGTFTSVSPYAFYGCYGLESVTLAGTVTSIGNFAFEFCDSLKTIKIRGKITSIGRGSFYGCENIESFDFGNRLVSVGSEAFVNTSLTSVVLPDTVTEIGEKAFGYNYKYGEYSKVKGFVVRGKKGSAAETYANENGFIFDRTDAAPADEIYDYDSVDEGIVITKYKGTGITVYIPSAIDGKTVIGIEDGAFSGCKSLSSVTIPSTVESIKGNPFTGCTSLVDINVNTGNTVFSSVDGVVFNNDKNRINFFPPGRSGYYTIPDGVVSLSNVAFRDCKMLKGVKVPDSTFGIDEYSFGYHNADITLFGSSDSKVKAFAEENGIRYVLAEKVDFGKVGGCDWIYDKDTKTLTVSGNGETGYYPEGGQPWSGYEVRNLVIEDGVTNLRAGVFSGLEIESAEVPASVYNVGMLCFRDCKNLKKVTLTEGLVEIGGGAFEGCESLEEISLPSTLRSIGPFSFDGCVKLDNIVIPDGIVSWGVNPFRDTQWYKGLPDGDVYAGKTYLTYKGIMPANSTLTIKDGTERIAAGALAANGEQSGLVKLVIPSSVIDIGENSFYGCTSLKSVTIPSSVKNIYGMALGYYFDNAAENSVKTEGFTIYGEPGSVAEEYASKNGFIFLSSEPEELTNLSDVSKTSVPQNTSVFVKGAAKGGSGEYKYAFYYKKSTSKAWTTIGELYGKTTEVSFVPASVAKYLVKVNVKDGAGKIVTKIFNVNSTKPSGDDLVNRSVLDKTTTEKGKPITITGAASGGSGGYTYAFYYKKTTSKAFTVIGAEYSKATTATFIPASAAEYNVRINVKDSSGTIVTKQYKITATAPVQSLSNDGLLYENEVNAGTSVIMIGKASGGTAPYKYAFYYSTDGNEWKTAGTEFGIDTAAIFTPTVSGQIMVKIAVKDSTGKIDEKTFTVTVR